MEQPEAADVGEHVASERRLAAVVFTDVVGYSAMVGADEAGALARVAADLASMRSHCVAHGGECLNSMGDGLMLAFPSAVNALSFAIETQERFARRNETAEGSSRLEHRIGVHLGDVLRMPDGTLAGDGVNTAARLEGSAPPGGICMSQTVHDTVKGKLPFEATFAGAKTFKNIAEPVSVWFLHPRGKAGAAAAAVKRAAPAKKTVSRRTLVTGGAAAVALAGGAAWWLRRASPGSSALDPKSIAVLPFQNLGDDKETAYFADGIHEDLLTQLALVGQLKVVSRTSVMEYRKTTKKVAQIGDELKVATLVEGSVRRAGDMVRVTAQLIDAATDKHLWAANYDRGMRDIFKVQSDLANEIASALKVSLSGAEAKQLARVPTSNLQAYDLYLRHQDLERDALASVRMMSAVVARMELLERAVALDPAFALAWAKLGAEHANAEWFGLEGVKGDQKALAMRAIDKAVALAPEDLQVQIERAGVLQHAQRDAPAALAAYRAILARAPYNAEALSGEAEVLARMGRLVEAMASLERAITVDPRNIAPLSRLSSTYMRFRRYDRAHEFRLRMQELRPNDLELRANLHRSVYLQTGSWDSYDAWRASVAPDTDRKVARVLGVDFDRAVARRDFPRLLQLLTVESADMKDMSKNYSDLRMPYSQALIWRAAGDDKRAMAIARDALSKLEAAAGRDPVNDNPDSRAHLNAILGRREEALHAWEQSVAVARTPVEQEYNRRTKASVLAQLGDKQPALELLRSFVPRQMFFIHAERVELAMAPLWDEPGFLELVRDPAANAPLPFEAPLAAA